MMQSNELDATTKIFIMAALLTVFQVWYEFAGTRNRRFTIPAVGGKANKEAKCYGRWMCLQLEGVKLPVPA